MEPCDDVDEMDEVDALVMQHTQSQAEAAESQTAAEDEAAAIERTRATSSCFSLQ